MQTAANNLADIIRNKGYKQYVIANKAGFSAREFNDILHGRKIFKADHVKQICDALDVTPNELFGVNKSEVEK